MNWLIGVIVENLTSRKDKTYKITLSTQELSPEVVGNISATLQQFGYLAFKTENFTKDELKAVDELKADYEVKGQSPSKRLRSVLFRVFEEENEGFKDFDSFYEHIMEKLINHYKSKLP